MERSDYVLRNCIINNNESEVIGFLNHGLDPNFEGGWPIRLAARHGHYSIVKIFLQYGANPHLLSDSGASTLQFAVYSNEEWNSDNWNFLLSCCDSSQLADGASVAIIFQNVTALKKILETGRCNTNIPTTLTGKTVEDLAKGYKLQYLLNTPTIPNTHMNVCTPVSSPRISSRNNISDSGTVLRQPQMNSLSPSVAQFFHQTASQTSLTPPRINLITSPPTID